jgi:hypothetical protein
MAIIETATYVDDFKAVAEPKMRTKCSTGSSSVRSVAYRDTVEQEEGHE